MIYRILLIVALISQVACGQSFHKEQSAQFLFVDSLLQKDQITVEVLEFTYPADIQEINLRFQKALADNKEWAQEYISKYYKEGEGLPYNEKFGISIDEYKKIKDLDKLTPVVNVKSSFPLKIIRGGNSITFKSSHDETRILEFLKIDTRNQLLMFNNDTIPFSNEIRAPVSTPMGEWNGYSWKKEVSNQEKDDKLNIDKLISRIVEIDFGKVKLNSRGLLRIKYREVDKGQVKANFDMLCYIY